MTKPLVIVRRAFSTYTVVQTVESGNWLEAMNRSMAMERQNNDGEYFVRGEDEPNSNPAPYGQSGFDYL
jgi:hypothetical protein